MPGRQHERFIKRLETEFVVKGTTFRGICRDFSEHGIFIRTRNGPPPDTELDMKIYLPRSKETYLKGTVMRTTKTDSTLVKNGVGVRLTQRDQAYMDFLDQDLGITNIIVVCHECRVKNKVPRAKLSMRPKCGKCKQPLRTG